MATVQRPGKKSKSPDLVIGPARPNTRGCWPQIRIARGDLVHLTATDAGHFAVSPDIAAVPVTGLPLLRSALVWRRRQADPKARAFIRVARETLRKRNKPRRR